MREEKEIIRRNILSTRKLLKNAELTHMSEAICARVASLPEFAQAKTVMIYAPFRNEVDTAPLREICELHGKAVVLPRTVRSERRLMPVLVTPGMSLVQGEYGIFEPPATAEVIDVASIDFVCAPGVAFTPQCYRLGYGGGYYDRFVSQSGFRAFTCGLAFSVQMVEALPISQYDRPVDAVATERAICRRIDRT